MTNQELKEYVNRKFQNMKLSISEMENFATELLELCHQYDLSNYTVVVDMPNRAINIAPTAELCFNDSGKLFRLYDKEVILIIK